jgi:hypothetical protein
VWIALLLVDSIVVLLLLLLFFAGLFLGGLSLRGCAGRMEVVEYSKKLVVVTIGSNVINSRRKAKKQ